MLTLVVQFKIFYVLVHTVIFAFHLLAEQGYFDMEVLIKNLDLKVKYTSNVFMFIIKIVSPDFFALLFH